MNGANMIMSQCGALVDSAVDSRIGSTDDHFWPVRYSSTSRLAIWITWIGLACTIIFRILINHIIDWSVEPTEIMSPSWCSARSWSLDTELRHRPRLVQPFLCQVQSSIIDTRPSFLAKRWRMILAVAPPHRTALFATDIARLDVNPPNSVILLVMLLVFSQCRSSIRQSSQALLSCGFRLNNKAVRSPVGKILGSVFVSFTSAHVVSMSAQMALTVSPAKALPEEQLITTSQTTSYD